MTLKMNLCRRKNTPRLILKAIVYISCFILGLFTLKRLITGEKIYYFEFKYPAKNVLSILDEIERTGRTSEQPLNNVTQLYSVKHEPALSFCKSVLSCENLEMIFIVKSFSGNFGQRLAIRNTYGNVKSIRMKTIFVLGYTKELEKLIDFESETYKDILQFNLTDNYANLVYKTIFSIAWLSDRKIKTQFVHFIDDDRLVNTINVYNVAIANIAPSDMKMIGHKLSFSRPFRQRSWKCYISLDEYEYDLYPPYVIGGTILTNMRVVHVLSRSIPYIKIIHIEDTFIGIIAKLVHIQVEHHSGFLPYYKTGPELINKLSSPGYEDFNSIMNGWSFIYT